MKIVLILCALLVSTTVAAQKAKEWGSSQTAVTYIESSDAGSSEAVIVAEMPLAHTRQFLATDQNEKILQPLGLNNQVNRIFNKLAKSLRTAASDVHHIVKLNIVVANVELLSETDRLVSRKFKSGRKPSITYSVGDLFQPLALIAVDAVAISHISADPGKVLIPPRERITQSEVAILPKGPVVYVSGQAATGTLAEATRGTLNQLNETLNSIGLSKENIVQMKSFVNPMLSLDIVKTEFSKFFKEELIPPLVFVEWVSSDPLIEIELIAFAPKKSEFIEQVEYITPPGMTSSPIFSKVVRLNYGKKVFLSAIYGKSDGNTDTQVNGVFMDIKSVLTKTGSDFMNLLKATYYITNDLYSKSLSGLRPKYYDPLRPPAASKATLKEINVNGTGILIDMIGTIKEPK